MWVSEWVSDCVCECMYVCMWTLRNAQTKQNKSIQNEQKWQKWKKKKKNEKRSEILSIVINELARVAHLRLDTWFALGSNRSVTDRRCARGAYSTNYAYNKIEINVGGTYINKAMTTERNLKFKIINEKTCLREITINQKKRRSWLSIVQQHSTNCRNLSRLDIHAQKKILRCKRWTYERSR